MSSRRPVPHNADAQKLRTELEQLKQQTAQVEAAGSLAQEGVGPSAGVPTAGGAAPFETLNGTEQAAGSLGVHPEAWKPIKVNAARRPPGRPAAALTPTPTPTLPLM